MTGALYRHYSVMQAGWSVVNCSHGAFYSFAEEKHVSLDTCAARVAIPRTHAVRMVMRCCVRLLLKREAPSPSSLNTLWEKQVPRLVQQWIRVHA